jgi:hypothetical protein
MFSCVFFCSSSLANSSFNNTFDELDGVDGLSVTSREGSLVGVTVPEAIKAEIASNTFMDCVTPKSVLRTQAHWPLAAVLKQSVINMGLRPYPIRKDAMPKLMAFATTVESGYCREGYHSNLHAADVTNRYASVLTTSGILGADSGRDHLMLMLSSVVAAGACPATAVFAVFQSPIVSVTFSSVL